MPQGRDLPPLPAPATYPAHQIGALSAEMIICLAAIIIPGQSDTYQYLRIVTGLLAESGQRQLNPVRSGPAGHSSGSLSG